MIRPSIIANTQEEFNERYTNVAFADIIHLDLMDGEFVDNTSLLFDVQLPDKEFHWHLMTNTPYEHIERLPGTVFYVHAEVINVSKHIAYCKKHALPVCFAVNPGTPLDTLLTHADDINKLLIMSVEPGQYGAPFVQRATEKINKVPNTIEVCVDGAMTPDTVKHAAYADCIVSGSYIQKTGEEGYKKLTAKFAAVQILRT